MADQNFDYLKISEQQNIADLLELYISNGYIPTTTRPTRISHSSATLIDNIYTTLKSNSQIQTGIITTDISDHLPVFTFIGTSPKQPKQDKEFEYRDLSDAGGGQGGMAPGRKPWGGGGASAQLVGPNCKKKIRPRQISKVTSLQSAVADAGFTKRGGGGRTPSPEGASRVGLCGRLGVLILGGGGAPMQPLAPGRWRPSVRHCSDGNVKIISNFLRYC